MRSSTHRNGPSRKKYTRTGYTRTVGFYGRYDKGGELKFTDENITLNPIPANGTIFLNGSGEASMLRIAQGTGESQRIGRKVTIKKIQWRFRIELQPQTSSANTICNVRLILYLDKQTNGAAATITDVMQANTVHTFKNLQNSGRFVILMDREYVLKSHAGGGNGTAEDYGEDMIIDTFYKDCSIPIEYSSTVGAISELKSGNINLLMFGSPGSITQLAGRMRIRYSDN